MRTSSRPASLRALGPVTVRTAAQQLADPHPVTALAVSHPTTIQQHQRDAMPRRHADHESTTITGRSGPRPPEAAAPALPAAGCCRRRLRGPAQARPSPWSGGRNPPRRWEVNRTPIRESQKKPGVRRAECAATDTGVWGDRKVGAAPASASFPRYFARSAPPVAWEVTKPLLCH